MKQKIKNIVLLSLIFSSLMVVLLSGISLFLIIAIPFQSTTPGSSVFENIARMALMHPVTSMFFLIFAAVTLLILKEPLEWFLKRNKVLDKIEQFFVRD